MVYINITIFDDELNNDELSMILWHYYCMYCATVTVTTFIMERLIWTIEFATIIHDYVGIHEIIVFFFSSIVIFGGSIYMLVLIICFIVRYLM